MILISDLENTSSPRFLDLANCCLFQLVMKGEGVIMQVRVIVASTQGREWDGEIGKLNLDFYVFKTEDGLHRLLVLKNGGWPTFMGWQFNCFLSPCSSRWMVEHLQNQPLWQFFWSRFWNTVSCLCCWKLIWVCWSPLRILLLSYEGFQLGDFYITI